MAGELVSVLLEYGIQVAGAALVATVLLFFARRRDRGYLRFWVWSWAAFAVFAGAAMVARLTSPAFSPDSALPITVSILSLTAGYLQLVWLLLGSWEFVNRRRLKSTWLVPSISAVVVIAVGLTLVGLGDPEAAATRYFARVGVRAATAGAAFLAAGTWLLLRTARRSTIAGRVLPTAFGLYGLYQFLVAYVALPIGSGFPAMDTPLRGALGYADMSAQVVIGFGVLLWLLEIEHQDLDEGRRRLAESEERYRTLAETATDAIITVDEDARIIFANKGAERVFGYTPGDLVGRLMTDLQPPHLRDDYLAALLRYIRTGQLDVPREGFAAFGLHQSGRVFPLEMSLTDNLIGGQRHLTGIIRDVSERQRLEERLRQSQRMEAVGRLAGGVAHDFNNLLTAISGYAELSLKDLDDGSPVRMNIDEIQRAADRAASLTSKLLALSRRQAVEPKRTDLNASISELIPVLSRVIGGHITTSFQLATTPLFIDADPGLIDQVLLNLAINARDAMPTGGQLSVTVDSVTLEASTSDDPVAKEGLFCKLQVTDSGVGIPAEHLSTIFEPFFTTKDVGRGTGLGLATTYGLIQQHGGWIDVRSEPGQGTTFDVFLPCSTDDAPASPPATTPAVASEGRETILLVEDETPVRNVVRRSLERAGYSVLTATNGPDALVRWRQHGDNIHLLVTDVVMPGGMTGLDLMAALRRQQPRLPVLLMSGYHDQKIGGDVVGAECMSKPFALTDLLQSVRQLLDEHRPDRAYHGVS